MSPWQLLRAGRATQAAPGHHVRQGPGPLVHYSSVPAAAGLDGRRSVCLSAEKITMRELNGRLASFLQQVQSLEAANQKLESQIQMEMDRKCPRELRELDGHLRTVSLLQDQISECLSDQAQVKLQLLNAELLVFDLNLRWKKEHERRGCLETELSNLRQLEEELQVHRLPELQNLLHDQTGELTELQIQHQQNMQGLLAQMSGGVTVEIQPAESSDLVQQLDDLRQTSVVQLDQNQRGPWFNTEVSVMRCPEVTFNLPAESQVIQAELEDMRRSAASLDEELTHLQTLNTVLEASGSEQDQSFVQQLVVLQQTADSLCTDLDSVLQATAQQAADHQTLLDVKTRLEAEIQDYRRLLDGLSPQGVSSLHSVAPFCVPASPSVFRRTLTGNQTVSVHGGSVGEMEEEMEKTVTSKHPTETHIQTSLRVEPEVKLGPKFVTQFTASASAAEKLIVNQDSWLVPDKQPAVIQAETSASKQTTSETETSLHKYLMETRLCVEPEVVADPRKETAAEEQKGTMVICAEGSIQAKNPDPPHVVRLSLETSAEGAGGDAEEVSDAITSISGSQTLRSEEAQGKVTADLIVSDDTGTEKKRDEEGEGTLSACRSDLSSALSQASNGDNDKQPAVIQAETFKPLQTQRTETSLYKLMAETILCAEPEVKQGTRFVTETTTPDPRKQPAAEEQKEAVVSVQMTCTEDSIQAKNPDPPQAVPLSLETSAEGAGGDAEEVSDAITSISGSQTLRSEEAQGKVTADLIVSDDTGTEKKRDEEGEGTLSACRSDLSSALSQASNGDNDKQPAVIQAETFKPLQTQRTETSLYKLMAETILCAEPEVKQGTRFVTETTTPDPRKQPAAEEQKEAVVSVQMTCTEDSIQAKNPDPPQAVPLSLETSAKGAGGDAGMQDTCVFESHILKSEEVSDLTPMDDKDIEKPKEKEDEVEVTLLVFRLDQSSALSNASNSEQDKVVDDANEGSGIATASSRSPKVQTNIESFVTQQKTTVDGLQAIKTETKIQTEVNQTTVCGEPEDKQGPQTLRTTEDQSTETDTGESVQMISIRPTSWDPAQDVPLGSEIKAEAVTQSSISGSHLLISEETQAEDEDIESQEKKGEEKEGTLSVLRLHSSALNQASSAEQNKDIEDAESPSGIAASSSCSADSNAKKVEAKTDKEEDKACVTKENAHVRPEVEGLSRSSSRNQALPQVDGDGKVWILVGDGSSRGTLNQPTNQRISQQTNIHADKKDVQSKASGCVSQDHKETSNMEEEGVANRPGKVLNKEVKSVSFPENEGTRTSGSVATNNCGTAGLASTFTGRAASSSDTVSGNTGVRVRFSSGSGLGSLGSTGVSLSNSGSKGRFSSKGGGERIVHAGSLGRKTSLDGSTSLPSGGQEDGPSVPTNHAASPQEKGRFSSGGSAEWIVYSGSLGRKSLSKTKSEERPSVATFSATSTPELRTFGSAGSGEWVVTNAGPDGTRSPADTLRIAKTLTTATSPESKCGSRGSGEWRVYSGSAGRMSSWAGSNSLPNADREETPSVVAELPASPAGSVETGRFGSGGSVDWRVYGGSTGSLSRASSVDRVSVSAKRNQVISPPGSHTKLSSSGSSRLSSEGGLKRSSSLGSGGGGGGGLSSSSSGGRLSSSSGNFRTSNSRKLSSTGSSEWKPVYSPVSARKTSVGSTGRSGGGGAISTSLRTLNTAGRTVVNFGSAGWLNSSTTGGIYSPGSDRVGGPAGGRINSSSGSGRTNSTGGRVISSSDRPIRSTGSGAGGSAERISVCKMAALTMSAAGRERSDDKQRQQQAKASSPLLQRWLNGGVNVKSAEPDDITL